MRITHNRVYPVYVDRTPGRLFVHVPDLPWSAIEPDEQAIFEAWERDLAGGTLTRRILLPNRG